MPVLPESIASILAGFDDQNTPLMECDVHDALKKAIAALSDRDGPSFKASVAEAIVFLLTDNYQDEKTGWGTYFGPFSVMKGEDGKWYENPGLKSIDGDVIAHWEVRAQAAKNPILRARYADAVWDLAAKATAKKPAIQSAHIAIDSYVEIVRRELYDHTNEAVQKLERALSISLKIGDKVRTDLVRDAVLELQKKAGGQDGDECWSFAFDLLVDKKNVNLANEQLAWIIQGLEKALADTVTKAEGEGALPLSAEDTAVRLATYYRAHNQTDDVHRVMHSCAKAFIAMAKRVSPMIGRAWLGNIYDLLNGFGCREDAEAIAQLMRELGNKAKDEMVEYRHEIKVPTKVIDDATDQLLTGSINEVMWRVGVYFTPDPAHAEKQVKESQGNTLMSFLTISQVDSEGRQTSQIGPLETDLEGRVVQQLAQNMQIQGPFLRHILDEAKKRLNVTAATVTDEVLKSPVFHESRRPTIQRGLQAWFDGEHSIAVHLLVPQIEQALRRLMVLSGMSAYKVNRRYGGIQLKLLDDILRDEITETTLGAPFVKYLLVLLTDSRGLNLRNDLCHGILEPDMLSREASDRLVHVLFVLAGLRERKAQTDDGAPPAAPQ